MNQDQAKGKFDQIKGKLKETWGRLTDDEIALYNGKQDQFFGKLQEKYGLAKEEAEDRIKEWDRAASDRQFERTSADRNAEEPANKGRAA